MKFCPTQITEEQLDNLQRACKGKRFAIVAARFHYALSEKLIAGARRALIATGAAEDAIDIYDVPGAFELPLAARTLILRRVHRDTRLSDRNGRYGSRFAKNTPPRAYAGVVAVGAVIRGETPHFDFIAAECARGIMNVQLETGTPVGFGVLTTDTLEQAEKRASAEDGDRGYDAAIAVASLLALRYSEAIKHAKAHSLNGQTHLELPEDHDGLESEIEVAAVVEADAEARIEEASSDIASTEPAPRDEPEMLLDAADELVDHFHPAAPAEEQGETRLSSDAPEENREALIVEDKTLTCKDCSKEFIFTADEQQFFADKGFQNDPQRCRECRQARRSSNNRNATQRPSFETVCAECGVTTTVPFTPRGDRPVYCRTCYAKHTPEPTTA